MRATWCDIGEDPQAAKLVRDHHHGNETVPTVRVGARVLTNPSAATVHRHARR